MIDLSQAQWASPLVHAVATDPGRLWTKDPEVAIDAPPDSEVDPKPEARWLSQALRTGICGAVSPRVVTLSVGGYRLYYTQILPRPGFPAGANDYGNSTARILSAVSPDGAEWTPEPGVRLSAQAGGAGEFRVVSSEVVPRIDGEGLRMYYECCRGTESEANTIRSAVSRDGGLVWTPEPGTRLETRGQNFAAPRIVLLGAAKCRLYCLQRGIGIISALSEDGGITFHREEGLRIAQDGIYDGQVAFAPEILFLGEMGYVMYYAGYRAPNRAYIMRAISPDGLAWRKEAEPVVAPGPGRCDAAKCSEMCMFPLLRREGEPVRYRMLYEACDGTTPGERGVWRIASATSANFGG